jgi:hypothetical protein
LIHELSLNSFVLIFRENKSNQSEAWKESFKLLSIQSESAIVELSNESIKFRSISLKSYYQNDDHTNDELSVVGPVLPRKNQNRSGPTTPTYSLIDRPR